MAQAYLIADLAFGDCAKGATTDALCRHLPVDLIVRYNGASQCAHNVVTPAGVHHTFSQFGSGMLANNEVRTHLSRFMLIDPITMLNESNELAKKTLGWWRRLTISARCAVITPFHKRLNRLREIARGEGRHGSCGMGVGVAREFELKYGRENVLCAEDIYDWVDLRKKLNFQRDLLQEEMGVEAASDLNIEDIKIEYDRWKALVRLVPEDSEIIGASKCTVFEGAQGVMLDEKYGTAPHNTWTNTTFENADTLLDEAQVTDRTRIGCFRTYYTRHGAGPFPTEDNSLDLPEPHNGNDGFQGKFRVGTFDYLTAKKAIDIVKGVDYLSVSHIDYLPKLELTESDFLEHIEQELEVPIGMIGRGPTAAHRTINLEVLA